MGDNCTMGSSTQYLQMIQDQDGAAALNSDSAASLAMKAGILLVSTVATLCLLL